MVKINRIYTKTGDDGSTGLVGGTRVGKDSLRVETYGEIDELNALLGMVRTIADRHAAGTLAEKMAVVQNELFDLGAELASPSAPGTEPQRAIDASQIARLEGWIDHAVDGIPELRSFVLPGGTELNSWLHLARTVCRRSERSLVRLAREEPVSSEAIIYVNRLSDLLFAMARLESQRMGAPEYLWKPGRPSPKSSR